MVLTTSRMCKGSQNTIHSSQPLVSQWATYRNQKGQEDILRSWRHIIWIVLHLNRNTHWQTKSGQALACAWDKTDKRLSLKREKQEKDLKSHSRIKCKQLQEQNPVLWCSYAHLGYYFVPSYPSVIGTYKYRQSAQLEIDVIDTN